LLFFQPPAPKLHDGDKKGFLAAPSVKGLAKKPFSFPVTAGYKSYIYDL